MASTLLEHTRSATPSAPALTSLAGRPAACLAHMQLHQPSVRPARRPGAHEECERLERLIVRDFRKDAKGHAERLAQGHRVRKMLDQIQAQAEKLVRPLHPLATPASGTCANAEAAVHVQRRIYADEDGVRKEEIAALRGENMYRCGSQAGGQHVEDTHRRHQACASVLGCQMATCRREVWGVLLFTGHLHFAQCVLRALEGRAGLPPAVPLPRGLGGALGSCWKSCAAEPTTCRLCARPRCAGTAHSLGHLALGHSLEHSLFLLRALALGTWPWACVEAQHVHPMRWRWALGTGQSLVRSLVCLPMLALGTQCWALPGARPVHS